MAVGDPESPLYSAHSQAGREGMTARDREELRRAAESERDRNESPEGQAINILSKIITDWKPHVERLKTLHGRHPIKVVGDVIEIDPNAEGGGDQNDASFQTLSICMNGAAATIDLLGRPPVAV